MCSIKWARWPACQNWPPPQASFLYLHHCCNWWQMVSDWLVTFLVREDSKTNSFAWRRPSHINSRHHHLAASQNSDNGDGTYYADSFPPKSRTGLHFYSAAEIGKPLESAACTGGRRFSQLPWSPKSSCFFWKTILPIPPPHTHFSTCRSSFHETSEKLLLGTPLLKTRWRTPLESWLEWRCWPDISILNWERFQKPVVLSLLGLSVTWSVFL